MRLLILCTLLSGCALQPHAIRAEYEHISHPTAGPPFGPTTDEDTLNHLAVLARWHFEYATVDMGLGYKLFADEFHGPRCTGIIRVSKEFSLTQ